MVLDDLRADAGARVECIRVLAIIRGFVYPTGRPFQVVEACAGPGTLQFIDARRYGCHLLSGDDIGRPVQVVTHVYDGMTCIDDVIGATGRSRHRARVEACAARSHGEALEQYPMYELIRRRAAGIARVRAERPCQAVSAHTGRPCGNIAARGRTRCYRHGAPRHSEGD